MRRGKFLASSFHVSIPCISSIQHFCAVTRSPTALICRCRGFSLKTEVVKKPKTYKKKSSCPLLQEFRYGLTTRSDLNMNTANYLRNGIRHFSSSPLRLQKFTPKCPPPTYDTGCTYCRPSDEIMATIKSPPESIRNTVPPLRRVIVYLSGSQDNNSWPKRVETAGVMKIMSKVGRGDGNMIVLSTLTPEYDPKVKEGFRIYPNAKDVYLNAGSTESDAQELFDSLAGDNLETNEIFEIKDVHKTTVLICGHTKRDKRCGVMGELLRKEFNKVIEHDNLKSRIDVALVSHVGGHVYAGNVIILKPDGSMIWYGMVQPHHVQGIIEKSIHNDEIIEELSRN